MKKIVIFLLFLIVFSVPAYAKEAEVISTPHFSHSLLVVSSIVFGLAVIHTFATSFFNKLAHKYKEGSVLENLFHLLGEVEAVFLIWAGILSLVITIFNGWADVVSYIESLNYTEPAFVFVIMAIASTKPVIDLADKVIRKVDTYLPFEGSAGFLVTVLIIGPLLGSFITEPAAMTVSALILYRQFFARGISEKAKYIILATLFVNISIGGTLTNFAAPPVVLVAGTWGYDLVHMFTHFGYKAIFAVIINAYLASYVLKKELNSKVVLATSAKKGEGSAEIKNEPMWVSIAHLLFLAFTVFNAHHMTIFMGGFIFFLGFVTVTKEYQEQLKLKESLLVAGFLAGLVTLGTLQKWWIAPIFTALDTAPLFAGVVSLTAITDNAALTYLASQVDGLADIKKYAVLSAAVAGGGLTVIANAPNPAGYSILGKAFENGVNALKLLRYALLPTIIAIACFWIFPV